MGNQALIAVRRTWQNWNVENRAQRVLERHAVGKGHVQAPLHPSSVEAITNARLSVNQEEIVRKYEPLHERLKSLHVSTHETPLHSATSSRVMTSVQLAAARNAQVHEETGYPEPAERVSIGCLTLRETLDLLGEPVERRVEKARELGLSTEQMTALFQYYRLFKLVNEEDMLQAHEQQQQRAAAAASKSTSNGVNVCDTTLSSNTSK